MGWVLMVFCGLWGLQGCRSAYVQTEVVNAGHAELHNIEVDYPSASFGISSLAPGASFDYRFQIQDAGRMKVEFSDNAEHTHSDQGPYIAQGQRGTLKITLNAADSTHWRTDLRPAVSAPPETAGK